MGSCLCKKESMPGNRGEVAVDTLGDVNQILQTANMIQRRKIRIRSLADDVKDLSQARGFESSETTLKVLTKRSPSNYLPKFRDQVHMQDEMIPNGARKRNTVSAKMKLGVMDEYGMPIAKIEEVDEDNYHETEKEKEKGVTGGTIKEEENFRWSDHEISEDEENLIRQALVKHFLFSDLTEEVMQLVLADLILYQLKQGKTLYEEGSEGNYFYIVAKGDLESFAQNVQVRTFHQWDCLGEMSLVGKCKREETVKCLTDVCVYVLAGESFREIQTKMNEIRLKDRFSFLNSISIFKALDNISKNKIVEKIKTVEFQPYDKIISMGEIGEKLYILKEGLVSCRNQFKEIRKLGKNEYFGENAILIDIKRTLDVIALQQTLCFVLSKADLKDALGDNFQEVILFSLFQDFLANHTYFRDAFIESLIYDIFRCFSLKLYSAHEKIYNEKLKSNKKIIVVIEGSLMKEHSYELIAGRGAIIGEEVLKNFANVPKDFIAYPDCIALEADLETLSKVIKLDLNLKPLNLFHRINKLKRIYLFKNLSEKTIESIAVSMKKLKFKSGDVIVQEDTFGDELFLITKGRVRVTKNGKVLREVEHGNCFGEMAMFNSEEKRTASVEAIDKVICYVLSKADFDIIIGDKTIKEYLQKKLTLQDTAITLKDLYLIKFLGKGKFGSVNLVHNKKTVYAIKSVSRRSADKQKILGRYFASERKVMLSLDHPFIVKMVKSLKNQNFCFFLLEFVNGKNLDDYLSKRLIKKNIKETQFYAASLLIMIDYLHKKLIAHRDIKPSNIMINSNGYLKLIDFGTAKIISDYTSTIIGTPHYIAPEILLGKGYSLSCDYWSVGICMYEIFYGSYPFGNSALTAVDVYKEIIHRYILSIKNRRDLFFPNENAKTENANSFISDLLQKKVHQRNCSLSLLKKKCFFQDFNWDELIDFKLEAPFKPVSSDWTQKMSSTTPFESSLEVKYK